ncbi:MAG: hypothetical protein Rubg2KO_37990 [Rubricoccaceae bacterium]
MVCPKRLMPRSSPLSRQLDRPRAGGTLYPTHRLSLLAALLASSLILGCSVPASDGWQLAFADTGTEHWTDGWFLEGDKAAVATTPEGMVLTAGPVPGENASHAVLWTQRSFSGDVKVEYTYTRLDTMLSVNAVNILYLQATGLGTDDAPRDIVRSTRQRAVPTMSHYYLGMNALHVSYATTGPRRAHYVSARRYPASSIPDFPSTQIQPIYEDVELFEPGRPYRITATKEGGRLTFIVEGDDGTRTFAWDTTAFPPVEDGRIGFRHMWTRSARYRDIRISVRP